MSEQSTGNNSTANGAQAKKIIIWFGALVGITFPFTTNFLIADLFTDFVWVDPLLMPADEMLRELMNSGTKVRNALLGYAVVPLLYLPIAIAQHLTLKRQGNDLASGIFLLAIITVLGMSVGIARWPVLWIVSHEFGPAMDAQVLYPLFLTVDWIFGVVIEQFVGEFFWALWMGATALALWGQRGVARVLCWFSLLALLAQIPGTFRSLYPEYAYLNEPNVFILPLWGVVAGVWLIVSLKKHGSHPGL